MHWGQIASATGGTRPQLCKEEYQFVCCIIVLSMAISQTDGLKTGLADHFYTTMYGGDFMHFSQDAHITSEGDCCNLPDAGGEPAQLRRLLETLHCLTRRI